MRRPKNRAPAYPTNTLEEARGYLLQACVPQPNGCWEWKYPINGSGYGTKMFQGKKVGAHELSYRVFVDCEWVSTRKTPVCHKCNNRKCINPRHLYGGTNSKNRQDCLRIGTHNTQKITPEKVREIRSKKWPYGTKQKLAKELGVSISTITNIFSHKTWKFV